MTQDETPEPPDPANSTPAPDAGEPIPRSLPSERPRAGDPRQVGFQSDPSPEHLERSAEALQNVARMVTSASSEGRELRVCFCHVRLAPRLPFNLYAFHVVDVDDAGLVVDGLNQDVEIRYAIVVNQPVAMQTDVAVRFLLDLVGRQGPISEVSAGRTDLRDLPLVVAEADSAAAEVAWDTLRVSLSHAANTLVSRAETAGYRLNVRYERDPLPTRESVMRRVPALRLLYNDVDQVRDAVDRTVTALGTDRGKVSGGPEAVRAELQRHTTLLGIRQFMNQTVRDADVLGNGFLEFGSAGLDPTLRCLRPEHVEVEGPDSFSLIYGADRQVLQHPVMHLRGLEQLESRYGMSPWEPLLYMSQRRSVIESTRGFIAEAKRGPRSDAELEQLASLTRVIDVVEKQTQESLDTLLWFPRFGLPPASTDLYFTGQERL